MTDPTAPDDRAQDRDSLAAELALGLLEGEERATALRLCLSDRSFAAAVDAWAVRFGPLYDEVAGTPPPERVWRAVAARTDGGADSGAVVRRLRFWQAGAVGSGAIAAGLALTLMLAPPTAAPPTPAVPAMAVAQLVGQDSKPMLTAAYDPASGALRLNAAPMPSGDRMPELWIIPADGVPRSLGMVHMAQGSRMMLKPATRQMMTPGVTLAITLEEPSGMPHAKPSGAPVLAGKISTI